MHNSHPTKIAVLIPAYNEQTTIQAIVNHCLRFTQDICVVNDGSTDNTGDLLKNLPITTLHHDVNKGKSESLVTGILHLKAQGFSHVISIDADGQHNPDDLPRLISAINHHPNKLIIAARLRKTTEAPRIRLLANHIADFFISWTAGQKILDSQSGFRVYPTELCHLIAHYNHAKTFVFESELLIKASMAKTAISAIAIDSCYPANARASYFQPGRDIFNIVKMVGYYLIKRGLNLPGLVRVLRSNDHLLDF